MDKLPLPENTIKKRKIIIILIIIIICLLIIIINLGYNIKQTDDKFSISKINENNENNENNEITLEYNTESNNINYIHNNKVIEQNESFNNIYETELKNKKNKKKMMSNVSRFESLL